MNPTALDHELVLDYLCALDVALRGVPEAQARELEEQIATHLAEVISPDADDQEVAAVLRRLGSPAGLAAEARAGGAVPGRAASKRALSSRARRLIWLGAALAVIAAAAGAKVAYPYLSAGPLTFSQGGDWWYPQDVKHQAIARADTAIQNSAPLRYGQRQGYVISVYNGTTVNQTITADASGPTGWNSPGSGTEQLAVSTSYKDIANGLVGEDLTRGINWSALPVTIPPFQSRLVHVLWTSNICGGNSIDKLSLRVRVGWFTRTEVIPQEDWVLFGPDNGRCHR